MNKQLLTTFIKNAAKLSKPIREFAKRNAPEILTGVGIATGVATVILTNKATIKATIIVEEMKKEGQEPTKKDIVKATWREYVPGVVTGVGSVACIVAGAAKGKHARALLTAAYNGANLSLQEWQRSTHEIAPEKYKEIKKKVDDQNIETVPNINPNSIRTTANGNDIFYDKRTGQYFTSSRKFISQVVNDANAIINEKARSIMSDGNDPEDWFTFQDLIEMFGENSCDLARCGGWNLILYPNRLIEYDICPTTCFVNGLEETVHILNYYGFYNTSVNMDECCG